MSILDDLKIREVEKHKAGWMNVVQLTVNGGNGFMVSDNPFGNCQNFSIGYFCNLLSSIPRENWKDIVQELRAKYGGSKALLVADLNDSYFEDVVSVFSVIGSHEYTSSNGSDMVSCTIDMRQ